LPASANILAKAACGIADDVLSCLLLSTQAALIFCPAMNEKMFLHPAVQANIACLKKRGCIFVGPIKGRLSNGKIGLGRLAQTETILQAVKKALS
jgi:phosphopantothenoylcysteine decarboxylase/phosphopantothenate--cysteine ligase